MIIVSVGHGVAGMEPYEYILNEERLKIVTGVEKGRVCTINADIASRSGPRILDATETVYGYLSEFFNSTEEGPALSTHITPKPSGFEVGCTVIGLLAVMYLLRRNR